jgi:hypothetical protein
MVYLTMTSVAKTVVQHQIRWLNELDIVNNVNGRGYRVIWDAAGYKPENSEKKPRKPVRITGPRAEIRTRKPRIWGRISNRSAATFSLEEKKIAN